MIPISSQSPTLPSHNSLNYELLSLTAICGEVPCTCSARLTASESYRKKVVTSLTHDKLLRIFSRHHLRGYRLGVRGKRLLLQQEPERFAFYLSGCSDTNAIKSEISRRIRLHRIAQTYVTMLNTGFYGRSIRRLCKCSFSKALVILQKKLNSESVCRSP